jgi:myosin heavy subunit
MHLTTPLQLSEATWPKYSGSAQDGCLEVIKAEKLLDAEYQVGRTKIFIRNPMTVRPTRRLSPTRHLPCLTCRCVPRGQLFRLEEDRNEAKHRLATQIRARVLAFLFRKKYQKMRAAAIKIEAVARGRQVSCACASVWVRCGPRY